MAYYFVAQTRIVDPDEYSHYLEKFEEVFSKYRGEYIAVDESPLLLEGKWDYNKSVILKFGSKKDFEDWYYSRDYMEIMKHRLSSSASDIILLEGLE
jgi:uncharacterized protein (DUF1330 family)